MTNNLTLSRKVWILNSVLDFKWARKLIDMNKNQNEQELYKAMEILAIAIEVKIHKILSRIPHKRKFYSKKGKESYLQKGQKNTDYLEALISYIHDKDIAWHIREEIINTYGVHIKHWFIPQIACPSKKQAHPYDYHQNQV